MPLAVVAYHCPWQRNRLVAPIHHCSDDASPHSLCPPDSVITCSLCCTIIIHRFRCHHHCCSRWECSLLVHLPFSDWQAAPTRHHCVVNRGLKASNYHGLLARGCQPSTISRATANCWPLHGNICCSVIQCISWCLAVQIKFCHEAPSQHDFGASAVQTNGQVGWLIIQSANRHESRVQLMAN